MKRISALLIAAALIFTLAACGNGEKIDSQEEKVTYTETVEENVTENTELAKAPEETALTTQEASREAAEETTTEVQSAVDPSQWSKEEIIAFYKNAAAKSNPTAKSSQIMVLNKLIINNGEGALGFFTKILEPAIRSVIKKNELNFDGITGGFKNLSVNDTNSVKAYKSGEYTVVEMTLKNQTDGLHANEHDGSVGHAVSVLGDISKVLEAFPQFNVNLDNADIAVNYVNASVKVKINKDGIIEKGTWKYTCDPDISNVEISGINVKTADAEIDYIITVGGGF